MFVKPFPSKIDKIAITLSQINVAVTILYLMICFGYFSFWLFISSWKDKDVHTLSWFPWKAYRFKTSIPVFRPKRLENHTFCGGTYQYTSFCYMVESVLLGTKPLVDSIRHFIRDPSGVFFRMSPLWVSYRSMTSRFPSFAFVELVSRVAFVVYLVSI